MVRRLFGKKNDCALILTKFRFSCDLRETVARLVIVAVAFCLIVSFLYSHSNCFIFYIMTLTSEILLSNFVCRLVIPLQR